LNSVSRLLYKLMINMQNKKFGMI